MNFGWNDLNANSRWIYIYVNFGWNDLNANFRWIYIYVNLDEFFKMKILDEYTFMWILDENFKNPNSRRIYIYAISNEKHQHRGSSSTKMVDYNS